VRVLTALAFALAAGCYNPAVSQCQFKCGSGGCPAGTNCVDGECLTADGICPGATCMVNAPSNCATPVVIDSVDCATSCGAAGVMSQAGADTFCTNASWRLAVLDAPAKLANAPVLANDVLWVGAHRQGGVGVTFVWSNGTPIVASAWSGSGPSTVVGLDCVVLNNTHHLENRDCGANATSTNQHRALCDHD
jgi:hypothetical protein